MSTAPTNHTPGDEDKTAHEALRLAKKLEKEVNKNLMKGVLEASAENASWFGLIFAGVVVICMLGTATGRLYQDYHQLAQVGGIWEQFGYMITASIFLGIFFIAAIQHMILGRYVIYYALFFSTLTLAIAIFMNLVAIRSRILPQ
jgi:hypothetical protein